MKEGIEFCLKQLRYLETKCEIFDMKEVYKAAVDEMKIALLAALERINRGEDPHCTTSIDDTWKHLKEEPRTFTTTDIKLS